MSREDKAAELRDIVDELAEYAQKRHQVQIELDKLREQYHIIVARIQVEIAVEKDDRGKPVYSHQRIRDAALTAKVSESEQAKRLRPKIDELLNQIHSIRIEEQRLSMHRQILMLELGLVPPTGNI